MRLETGPLDRASFRHLSFPIMTGMRRPKLRALPLFFFPLLTWAEGGITSESPFVLVGDPAAAQAATPVELRGILDQGGVRYFNLVDAASHKGAWVALNEPGPQGWCVRSFETVGDNDSVTIELNGRSLRVQLVKPRTGKAAAQPQPPVQTAGMPPAPPQQNQGPITPVIINPTSAQQAKAQEDIMAEVRRRRLNRKQQAAGQPPAPPQN